MARFHWCPCHQKRNWRGTRKPRWPICAIRCSRRRSCPRVKIAPQPVPERAGEPSVFQHVIYIIKENRTYDQVLGDVKTATATRTLCTFGERVTPNQHQLVRDFVLLDNTYCCGILSADGHQWTDTAFATDYMEREFAGFPRSYPSGGGRTTATRWHIRRPGSSGTTPWRRAKRFAISANSRRTTNVGRIRRAKRSIDFLDCYRDFVNGSDEIVYACEPDIESLRPFIATNTIGWDLDVPDVWRAAQFIRPLKQFEAADQLPNLVILWLPNDHTSGTRTNFTDARAQVADNDLAFGRVVEAVSHSKFWTNTCLFAIEDDPQNGWDHVSGYRTTAYVASPYTKRGATVSTQYNQTSLLRTMELILGCRR